LNPLGLFLEPPVPLLTHPHTVYMACSECLPTHLNPLAERACFSQARAPAPASLRPTATPWPRRSATAAAPLARTALLRTRRAAPSAANRGRIAAVRCGTTVGPHARQRVEPATCSALSNAFQATSAMMGNRGSRQTGNALRSMPASHKQRNFHRALQLAGRS
jgi:hypothetical protein